MSEDVIIEKIKKLLRMKRGGTAAEVETALNLARELAAKHGIDMTSINPDESEKPIHHEDEVLGTRVSWESKYAALVVNQFFKVEAFQGVNESRTKYVYRFVGEAWDIQIAIYVYRFLCGHFRREWKTRRGRCRNRQAFLYGMYLGICSKLTKKEVEPVDEPGLIRLDRQLQRRNDYITKHWGALRSSSVIPDDDAASARRRGWYAGQDTEIRSGLGKQSEKPSLPPAIGQLSFPV